MALLVACLTAALTIVAPAATEDPDGDPLTVVLASPTTHGVISLAGDGGFTYLADPDYVGPDGFTFLVDDGRGGTATGAGTIDVVEAPRTSPTLVAATVGVRVYLTGIVTTTLAPTAMLTEAVTGAPLPGRVLTFHLPNGTMLCTAVTDAAGTAACASTAQLLLDVVLAGAYETRYAGDLDRLPVNAPGPMVLLAFA